MNLREAAELAIKALQSARSVFNGEGDTCGGCGWCHAPSYGPCEPYCDKDRAVKALRVALADTQDWDEVEALRASLREHMSEIHRLRAAGRQALEALDVWRDCLTDPRAKPGWRFSVVGQSAIAALRAALAEDAMQRLTDEQQMIESHIGDANKMVAISQESRQVEPAAYSYTDARGRTVLVSTNTAPYEDAKPLYTAPPGIVARAVATERDRIAAWVEDMCVGLDAKTIANGIRNNGNDDIRAFEVKK